MAKRNTSSPDAGLEPRSRTAARRNVPPAARSPRAVSDRDTEHATLTFLRSLWALDHHLRSTSKRMERELGITAPQRLVLRLLGRSPGLMPSQLADALHLDRGTLSGVLERLVERDLVTREPHPTDGRSVCLRLTVRGRGFDRETPGTVEYCVQRALAGLPPTQVRRACAVLDALASELEQAASGRKTG